MATDVRTTGSLYASRSDAYSGWSSTGLSWYRSYVGADYLLGSKKYVSSYRGKRLPPKTFSIHPCEIYTQLGISEQQFQFDFYSPRFMPRYLRVVGDVCTGSQMLAYAPNPSAPSWLTQASLHKAWAKSSEPELGVGNSLVELCETIEMLRRPLSSMAKFLRKRRNQRRLRDYGNLAVGTWLEARYGWRPLVKDISNYINFLRSKPTAFTAEMRRKHGTNKSSTTSNFWRSTWVDNMCDVRTDWTDMVKFTSSSNLYYTMTAPVSWQQRLGVDWASVPELVWEKIPLSFVVDWFFDVGIWLQAIKRVDQRSILGSCTSTVVDRHVFAYVKNAYAYDYRDVPVITKPGKYHYHYKQFVRVVNPALSAFPVVKPDVSSLLHSLDAVGLIYQRIPFGKFKR